MKALKGKVWYIVAIVAIIILSGVFAWMIRDRSVIWNDEKFTSEEQVSAYIEELRSQTVIFEGENGRYEVPVTNFLNASSKDVYSKMQKALKDNWLKSVLHQPIEFDYEWKIEEATLKKYLEENIVGFETEDAKDSTYTYDNKKVYIVNGHDGRTVSVDNMVSAIKHWVNIRDYEKVLPFNYVVTEFKKVNSAELAAEIEKPAVNAEIVEKDGVTRIIKASEGIKLSEEQQKVIDANNATPDFEFSVPLEKVQPEITEVDTSQLFTDTMGTYTSDFRSSGSGRSSNVSRATNLINGIVLNPGDEFSYCSTVGPVTKANGYAEATVYMNNKAVPGIGGGLCQVSSTLYNAVLLADLEVTERVNHSLPVSYVPKGRDATVASGSIDFKFKNNYNYPIKIVATPAGKYCKISIMGKATGKEVTLTNKMVSNSGGYQTWYLYKTVKQNGAIIEDNVLESKSTYKV